jgi:hypothetical protein
MQNSACEKCVKREGTRAILLCAMTLAVALSGCGLAVALFPLYDKTTVATDDSLLGRWDAIDKITNGSAKDECCWTIQKDGEHYILDIPDTVDKQEYISEVHLVKLGDAMFLDAEPADVTYSQTTQIAFPLVKTHLFGRIWIDKDSFRVAMLDEDWMKNAAKNGPAPLKFVVSDDDDVIITADTAELQTFAKKYANDTGAFSQTYDLKRHVGN